jgi:hypothetical protein
VYALSGEFHEKNAVYKLPVESVVSRIDGKRSLEQISELAGIDTFEACKTVAALQLLGLAGRVPDRPVQMPLAEPAAAEELVVETLEANPTQDVSLGQVLQLPTVEELQEDAEESNARPQQNIAKTLKIDHFPTKAAEPKQEEPVAAKTRKIPPPTFSTKDAARPAQETPAPLSGMSFSVRRKKTRWDPVREFLWFAVIVVIAGSVVGYYWFRAQQRTVSNEINIHPLSPPVNQKQAPSETKKPETPELAPENPPAATPEKIEPPAITEPPPKPAPAPTPPEERSSPLTLARMGKLPEASKLWRAQFSRQRSKLTIQILIACQEKTVQDVLGGLQNSEKISVLPMDFKGRSCYRVVYGIFSSSAEAKRARENLPQEFLAQPSPPQVVAIGKIL